MEWITFLFHFHLLSRLLWYFLLAHQFTNWFSKRRKLPPGPIGIPIVDSLFHLCIKFRPHEFLTKLANIHGPLMTVRLGTVSTVVASSPAMAREILQKQDYFLSGRIIPHAATGESDYNISMPWLSGGPHWRNLRRLCKVDIFTSKRLDALGDVRNQVMEDMVKHVIEVSESGKALDIGRLVRDTTLNLLSKTMFSVKMVDLNSRSAQELKHVIAGIMELAGKPNLGDYFPLLQLFDLQGIRRDIKIYYDRLHALFDDIINRRLQERVAGSERGDFLDVLIDHSGQHWSEFSRRDIILLLTALFLGGTETTTTTIEWAMAELLRNPQKMVKAQNELSQIRSRFRVIRIKKSNISISQITSRLRESIKESDISSLPYANAVLKETTRLHPPSPLLRPHRALTEVEICGYIIPKHMPVLVNAYTIGRDPDYWADPFSFKPERFLDPEVKTGGRDVAFTRLPFGAGLRTCPGMPLANRMMTHILASLLHHFDWKLPDEIRPEEMDMTDNFGFTLKKKVPLLAVPSYVYVGMLDHE